LATASATKLHLGMFGNKVILQKVLLPAVDAASLHNLTLTRLGWPKAFMRGLGAALVT
jgi:hypothetical protein